MVSITNQNKKQSETDNSPEEARTQISQAMSEPKQPMDSAKRDEIGSPASLAQRAKQLPEQHAETGEESESKSSTCDEKKVRGVSEMPTNATVFEQAPSIGFPAQYPTAAYCRNQSCKNYTGAPCLYCEVFSHDCDFVPHIQEGIRNTYFFNNTTAYNYRKLDKSSLLLDRKRLQSDIQACISNPKLHSELLDLQHEKFFQVTLPTPTYINSSTLFPSSPISEENVSQIPIYISDQRKKHMRLQYLIT